MEERNELGQYDKFDEELPGFRFHPTDEELVGFYLTRKIQQKPLSIELIKQIDIYKYDPWDLPKLATNGEKAKEWYFYCPRDRKYRNSTRPNRVTGAGFWKATGTDRPIYSSETAKCIGLKKSLVFYRGKAAKGVKTDWMMHEFRLPSLSLSSPPSSNRFLDKNIPLNEAWAICRIFKKANSNAKRALSHSWVDPFFETTTKSDIINPINNFPTLMGNKTNSSLQFGFCNDLEQSSFASFSPSYFPPNEDDQLMKASYALSSIETAASTAPASRCNVVNDATSLLLDMSTSILGGTNVELNASFNGFLDATAEEMQRNVGHGEGEVSVKGQNVGEIDDKWMEEFNYGFPSYLMWDSSLCPSDLSTSSYSTNKCYT